MPSRLVQSAVQTLSLSPFGRMLTTAPQMSSLDSSNASPIRHSILRHNENVNQGIFVWTVKEMQLTTSSQ